MLLCHDAGDAPEGGHAEGSSSGQPQDSLGSASKQVTAMSPCPSVCGNCRPVTPQNGLQARAGMGSMLLLLLACPLPQ